ncbi:MAG TPA: type II toxin-antitoxin system PemK/MazF family toxin [Longimicrobium sp.]|nr:type II toxin-antitoxin system PemK/MazF family toxin [Longimicrobium sp.]HSU12538.1 type II toxin-antitoxin system PemK/MazF family toxin [Longimicrobium sp.]
MNRFDVYRSRLDPTVGSEIQKARPCVIISPNEMNRRLRTVIIAPMTTGGQAYPTRVACAFDGKIGKVALDQIRTVDKSRLLQHLGELDELTGRRVLDVLTRMFGR